MILIHPSSLGKIMSPAKSKKDSDLSAGAITYCKELAKQYVYGFKPSISSKYLEKGLLCEDAAIELYNQVFFANLKKNTVRKSNQWLTGECDIDDDQMIIDIKNSWSLMQFPALPEDAHDNDYEWQGRGYMMLWDKPKFRLAFCLVTTPLELREWDDELIHEVDHIDPELRVTVVDYDRCPIKEQLIKTKCAAAKVAVREFVEQIRKVHGNG
jgi:hypothetical protein